MQYRLECFDSGGNLVKTFTSGASLTIPAAGTLICARSWPGKVDLYRVQQLEHELVEEGGEVTEQCCRAYLTPLLDLPAIRTQS